MSRDKKLLQRWEFRRRDDDLDSSSDDSKSSSGVEPVRKKHKLVTNLILPENDETSDSPFSQQESQLVPDMDVPLEFGKAGKMRIGPSKKNNAFKNKMKRGSMKKSNRKKNNRSKHEPVSLDDFKIFMKSMIEELKVARENMFTWMREEMRKLVAVELASRPTKKEGTCKQKIRQVKHQDNIELGMKAQNCNGGSLERSVKSDRTTDSNNCDEVLEERLYHVQGIETITSNEKGKVERLRFSVGKPIYSSDFSDQVITAPYLSSPTVLSEPRVDNHRLDSSRNYIQPGAARNKTGRNLERANLLIDSSTHQECFSGIQPGDQFGSFSQMGSQNMDCFAQHHTQASTMGTGFPVPLHQGLGNGINTPNQGVVQNSSRGSNILGQRLNGGAIRFSGGSRALSVASNFHSQMNYKTDGRLLASGCPGLKDGNLHPN